MKKTMRTKAVSSKIAAAMAGTFLFSCSATNREIPITGSVAAETPISLPEGKHEKEMQVSEMMDKLTRQPEEAAK